MLLEFSVENYLSFKEKTTFSMLASNDTNLNNNYVSLKKYNVLKTTSIYGANASGKSNLFKALYFFVDLVKNSNYMEPNRKIKLSQFGGYLEDEKLTSFELKMLINETKYIYKVSLNHEKIINESLYYYPNGYLTKIFERSNCDQYDITMAEKDLNKIINVNTDNKLFLATATVWNYDKTKPVYDFITKKIKIIFNIDQIRNKSLDDYYENRDKELKDFSLDFLKKADFNIDGYEVFKDEDKFDYENKITAKTRHNFNGKDVFFDINSESVGTQTIFMLLPVLRDVLVNDEILVFDELDRSLHPYLVRYIVNMFNSSLNKGSQLIFNTHDTNLLDLSILRKDQIWFTEKDPDTGESTLYPLDDFDDKNVKDIEKGYLLGRYGAVPYIEDIDNYE